jgi:hypothetical protein
MTRLQQDNDGPRGIEKWLLISIGMLLVAPFVYVLGMWSWNAKELPFSGPSIEFVVERGEPGMRRVEVAAIPEHAARMERGLHRCMQVRLIPYLSGTAILKNFECSASTEAPPPVYFQFSWQAGVAPQLRRLSDKDGLAVWTGGTELPPMEYSSSFGRREAEALLEKCRSSARAAGVSPEFEGVMERIAGPGPRIDWERPRGLIGGPSSGRWMAVRKETVAGSLRSSGWPDFSGLIRPLWRRDTTTTGVASCLTGQWTVLLHTDNWQEHPSFYRGGQLHWLGENHLLLTESTEPLRLLLIDLQATATKPARTTRRLPKQRDGGFFGEI